MTGRYKIATDVSIELVGIVGAEQHQIVLELTFNVEPERSATYTQPGEGASISIQTAHVVENYGGADAKRHEAPAWLWPMIEADDNLEREMLAEAWESDEAAREYQAEARREDALFDRGAA